MNQIKSCKTVLVRQEAYSCIFCDDSVIMKLFSSSGRFDILTSTLSHQHRTQSIMSKIAATGLNLQCHPET